MPYIGNTPALDYISYAVQNFTVTAGTTVYTLDYSVSNENDIALYINSVAQRPGASFAYSATGTTLTLTSATLATDTMYAVFIGRAVQTVTPPASSITNTMLSPSVITGQTAVTTPATDDVLLCYDTSATALRKITFANFGNAPAFEASLSTNQTISVTVATKIQYNTELFDTNGAYDNSVNYRFTPQVAGKYYVYHKISVFGGSGQNSLETVFSQIYKNGSLNNDLIFTAFPDLIFHVMTVYNAGIIEFNGTTDYVEAYGYIGSGGATAPVLAADRGSIFGAYRLIGV